MNGDGAVDINDANILINVILGKDTADKYNGRADVDGNGSVDVKDSNIVINKILGK
ncbi:dockerin type I domain-containing protein [Sodaliphilus sp.]|uniref:dockerin type I domain-containing protein n=1 Tax=Sodaliphilus sp. TaxID=2815818 RepID=UPI00388D622D